jgi:hypothetical protein
MMECTLRDTISLLVPVLMNPAKMAVISKLLTDMSSLASRVSCDSPRNTSLKISGISVLSACDSTGLKH